tara:strand:+ start:191 stop:358 length:168 start_codon:yes stop_codon:yes gene_type:complete
MTTVLISSLLREKHNIIKSIRSLERLPKTPIVHIELKKCIKKYNSIVEKIQKLNK